MKKKERKSPNIWEQYNIPLHFTMILMNEEVVSLNWVAGIEERKTVKTWFSSVEEIQITITKVLSLECR